MAQVASQKKAKPTEAIFSPESFSEKMTGKYALESSTIEGWSLVSVCNKHTEVKAIVLGVTDPGSYPWHYRGSLSTAKTHFSA